MMSDKVRPDAKRLYSMSFSKADEELLAPDRRGAARQYHALLPGLHPVKLGGDHIAVDFLVGDPAAALHSPPPPAGRTLALATPVPGLAAFDLRVSPRRVLAWLHSMPAYRAGVPVHLGRHADAGRSFDKVEELLQLLDPGRAVVYLARRPLGAAERTIFAAPRGNLLVELTATPRCASLQVRRDPVEVVRSAAGLDPRRLFVAVGPITADGLLDAARVLEALPRGSRLSLEPWTAGAGGATAASGPAYPIPGLTPPPRPPSAAALADLEARAHALGHTVTAWRCREGLARVGRGFPGVDRITAEPDLGRRALDLITCSGCPSRTQCHGRLDEEALLARLDRELTGLGLTPAAPPRRTGPRTYRVEVAEPTAAGDEAYLSAALGQVVAIELRPPGGGEAPGREHPPEAAVLRRWYATGFLPVTELNAAAERALADLARLHASWNGQGGAC